ncbi:nuclear transport factor 2 family protein [Myxococcota bacterium]|nr:nuclear transport factor 2 family protein [Myxococcota bacterium]
MDDPERDPAGPPLEPQDEVRAALDAFYAAFQDLDLAAMSRVWARRDQDLCVHPGWEVLEGWPLIRESWRAIFANTGFLRVAVLEPRIEVLGTVARVTNVEALVTVAGSQVAHSQVAATKLFLRTAEGWRLILHHGSPMAHQHRVEELGEGPTN